MKPAVNIFWFRRDLRIHDNTGLFHALQGELPVIPLFIFDRNILDTLENKKDARVEFIHQSLLSVQESLNGLGSSLEVFYGNPREAFIHLSEIYQIKKVFANEDYEPYARDRDAEIEQLLKKQNAGFRLFKDQVIFSKEDVLKDDGSPYTVFTPYSNKWKTLLNYSIRDLLKTADAEKYSGNYFKQPAKPIPGLASMGFGVSGKEFPAPSPDPDIINKYADRRDFPALDATSHLGIHLRFGTISIRQLVKEVMKRSPVFLNELIWREFYQMILWHFPHTGRGLPFKKAYDRIPWRNNENEFARWCAGKTGYPLVDAGMRQLNQTGFMHNRVRMVTASFLAKHLLIDWRWGETYFAERLLDYDLASNNGGWQWAAGCGCDAAPYFRVFSPARQQERFDPDGMYIRKWLPDFQEPGYPAPIVEHSFARDRAIRMYKEALAVDG